MARYRYFKDSNNTITCVSSFAGKSVRGVAKCAPEDTFDEEKGKALARVRCDIKIAKKRHDKAIEKELTARKARFAAEDAHSKAGQYLYDALMEQEALNKELEEILASIYDK